MPGLLVPQRPAAAAPSWHQVGHPPSPTSTASPTSTGLPTGGRNRVERSVGRLKQFRRVATRYDKRARKYLAWVTLAAAVIWL
jgi:transposase